MVANSIFFIASVVVHQGKPSLEKQCISRLLDFFMLLLWNMGPMGTTKDRQHIHILPLKILNTQIMANFKTNTRPEKKES